jgi:BirA family biotin operon repressor/biotin-[acetyl-CoA-carboxylase] ligase
MNDSARFRFLLPEWHAVLPSTNTVLKQRLEAGRQLPSGFVLASETQTRGRGRHARTWLSAAGRDLTFSFLYCGQEDATRLCSLPMAAALGVAEYLERMGLPARVKWPNDVRVGSSKIAGILAEQADGPGARIVVGVGLNVNMTAEQAALIDQPATSLGIETGRGFDVHDVLQEMLPYLSRHISDWQRDGFRGLRCAWLERCDLLDECVEVVDGDQCLVGRMEDVGKDGELLLRVSDGRLKEVWAGDLISLRASGGP